VAENELQPPLLVRETKKIRVAAGQGGYPCKKYPTGGVNMVLGIPIILITAIAVYMVVTVITTEYLRKYLYPVDIRNHRHTLILNWLVGMFFYLLMFLFKIQDVNFASFMIFIIITGALNAGYKFTSLSRWTRKLLFPDENENLIENNFVWQMPKNKGKQRKRFQKK
jgi:hypothetical protein